MVNIVQVRSKKLSHEPSFDIVFGGVSRFGQGSASRTHRAKNGVVDGCKDIADLQADSLVSDGSDRLTAALDPGAVGGSEIHAPQLAILGLDLDVVARDKRIRLRGDGKHWLVKGPADQDRYDLILDEHMLAMHVQFPFERHFGDGTLPVPS